MKVIRNQTIDTNNVQIGDQILIKLKSKTYTFSATAQRITKDGIIFMFDECVAKRQMNSEWTNEGGYEASELKKWMEKELLDEFPADIRNKIGYITLPTYGQIFGHDPFYKDYIEPDSDKQFRLMKVRKNRIADYENCWEWYWLKNATKKEVSAAAFAHVHNYGSTGSGGASTSRGVRPVFLLKTK